VVEDWNELTHHLLEVTLHHLQATKGKIPGTGMSMKPGLSTPSAANIGNMGYTNFASQGMRQPQLGGGGSAGAISDKVLEVYKKYSADFGAGLSFDEVLGYLKQSGSNTSLNELKKIVDSLSNEGIIYATIDDSHYKSTD
jgi:Replication protein A C terminal